MALLWIDGFEGYGSSGDVTTLLGIRGYGVSNSAYNFPMITAGRISGYSFCGYNGITSGYTIISTPALTTDPTIIVGVAFKLVDSSMSPVIALYDNATLGVNVTLTSGAIVVKLDGTTISTYSISLIPIWYYLEMKVFCHATSGTVEIRLNGTTIISLIGINTKAGADSFHNIFKITSNSNIKNTIYNCFDDLYICDGSGSTVNDFQGDCRVIGIFPNADTSTIEWTTSAGTTHYNLVDENPENGATDYVYSSTSGQRDLYTYPSLVGTGTIIGIQIATTAALSSGTSIILEQPILSGSATEIGPDNTLTSSSYLDFRHISLTDPNTGLAWTIANLAAAKIGVKVV
ncbi:MAG: hypothetical protein M0R50_03180 [Candidatus Cloacimonetes bacterium]|jgi:hypothetical protein|nr:hypothetical protein [Candidatus Cloacimonadota bacterium]